MPSITMSNALAAVFGTTKTTGSYVPLATSAGGPDGIISMANLASVLGGLPSMFNNVTDANEVTTPGFYQHSSWTQNTPASAGILIMPYYYTGYWKFQLFCDNQSTHLWFRSGNSSTYGAWKQIV